MEKPQKNMEQKFYSFVYYKFTCIGGVLRFHSDYTCLLSGNRYNRFKGRYSVNGNVCCHNPVSSRRRVFAG